MKATIKLYNPAAFVPFNLFLNFICHNKISRRILKFSKETLVIIISTVEHLLPEKLLLQKQVLQFAKDLSNQNIKAHMPSVFSMKLIQVFEAGNVKKAFKISSWQIKQ